MSGSVHCALPVHSKRCAPSWLIPTESALLRVMTMLLTPHWSTCSICDCSCWSHIEGYSERHACRPFRKSSLKMKRSRHTRRTRRMCRLNASCVMRLSRPRYSSCTFRQRQGQIWVHLAGAVEDARRRERREKGRRGECVQHAVDHHIAIAKMAML